MSNSKVVIERVLRDYECVVCGGREYDVREITAVGDRQDDSVVGERYDRCTSCGEQYDSPTDYDEKEAENV